VSETELYHRVRVERVPEVMIVGNAVADTIHLVAELVDNATAFSPPRSQVHVNSTPVARGVVVEVEDQGLGMSEEDRDRANAMMAEPPEFDAMALKADSRLGLFVVARLGARLNIKVEFRVSPYGGTRAIVLIPATILATEGVDGDAHDSADTAVGLPLRDGSAPYPVEGATNGNGHRPAAITADLDDFPLPGRVRLSDPVGALSGRLAETPVPQGVRAVEWPTGNDEHQGLGGSRSPEPAVEGNSPVDIAEPSPRLALPQRRPQQNLAPQLRVDVLPDEPAPEDIGDGPSPEDIRAKMSAFQRGSVQGRQAGDSFESS
jgi:hypothetical protein